MYFTQKIYIHNKPLILCNDATTYLSEHPIAHGYLKLSGAFPRNFRLAIAHINKFGTLGAIIEDLSEEALIKEMYALYAPVQAGGGVVLNEDEDVLMIFRRGKWDLPKGKLDDNEDLESCALREVAEETGIHNLKMQNKICETFHVYNQKGEHLLKHTTWYKMLGSKKDGLQPQKEENITEARWVNKNALAPITHKTYDAIKEVLKEAGVM